MAWGDSQGDSEGGEGGLTRTIGLPLFTVYGIKTIVGAGIFVLMGEVAGRAGYLTPLVFLAAGLAAGITALAYAELGARMPSAGGPSEYVRRAFDIGWLAVATGYAIIVTGIVSAATIATGFAGYLQSFVEVRDWLAIAGILTLLSLIAASGLKQTAWVMFASLTAGFIALGLVIYGGITSGIGMSEFAGKLGDAAAARPAPQLLGTVFLTFYAFIGFEDMVHTAEEVKDVKRTLPRGLVLALVVTILLYVATGWAALALVEPQSLREASAPLVLASEEAGFPGWIVGGASLLVLPTGALAQLVMASRVAYDLGENGHMPKAIAKVSERTNTPAIATFLAGGIAIALTFGFPLDALASITSFVILAIFGLANAVLIVLHRRDPDAAFRVPGWLPFLGIGVCVVLLAGSFFSGGGGH